MCTEYVNAGNNVLEIVRASRGNCDIVLDKGKGWYVEKVIDGIPKRSKTYPTSQEADTAIERGSVRYDFECLEPK